MRYLLSITRAGSSRKLIVGTTRKSMAPRPTVWLRKKGQPIPPADFTPPRSNQCAAAPVAQYSAHTTNDCRTNAIYEPRPIGILQSLWRGLDVLGSCYLDLGHGSPRARALSEGSPSNWAVEGGPAVRT
jgi:hypothetical protein